MGKFDAPASDSINQRAQSIVAVNNTLTMTFRRTNFINVTLNHCVHEEQERKAARRRLFDIFREQRTAITPVGSNNAQASQTQYARGHTSLK